MARMGRITDSKREGPLYARKPSRFIYYLNKISAWSGPVRSSTR